MFLFIACNLEFFTMASVQRSIHQGHEGFSELFRGRQHRFVHPRIAFWSTQIAFLCSCACMTTIQCAGTNLKIGPTSLISTGHCLNCSQVSGSLRCCSNKCTKSICSINQRPQCSKFCGGPCWQGNSGEKGLNLVAAKPKWNELQLLHSFRTYHSICKEERCVHCTKKDFRTILQNKLITKEKIY